MRKRTDDPIERFVLALERARRTETTDATAMTLATADAEGRPSARQVLLKTVDQRGFVFFTNLHSRKAEELAANPNAALCIHWPKIKQQVRIEGRVERTTDEESDDYFASRSRLSQLGAWASKQSQPLDCRKTLIQRFLGLEARFAGGDIPRPSFWGGYRVVPRRIEFWYNQLHRLHDRVAYERTGDRSWVRRRLFP